MNPNTSEQPLTSALPADQRQSNETALYQLALSMCRKSLQAGALPEALSWARQAEQIGLLSDIKTQMPDVTRAYINLILESCTQAQELLLTGGNVTHKQALLSDITEKAADHLVLRLQAEDHTVPLKVALIVQGYARQLRSRITEHLAREQPTTPAQELESTLDCLSTITQYADKLSSLPEEAYHPLDKRLVVAATAVSNARSLLGRLFSSDWVKAEIFCRRAYLLLTRRSITEGANHPASGDAYLDNALRTFPAAHQALLRHDYRQSNAYLRSVEESLQKSKGTKPR